MFSKQYGLNKSASGVSTSFTLIFIGCFFKPLQHHYMDPSSSPKGFRKRWREAAASSHQLLADRDASELESERALDEEAPPVNSSGDLTDVSDSDAKRFCGVIAHNGVASAFTILRKSVAKMPWETGPLSPLFTGQFNMQQKTGLLILPLVGIEDVSSKLDTKEADHEKNPKPYVSLTSFVKNRIAASKFIISDEDLRVPALGHFRNLICSDLKGTTVGLSLLDKAGKLCAEDDLATTVSDTLARKSTGALLKRVSSMVRFFSWMVHHRDTSCFRPSEKDLYDYMQYLRHSGAGATAASHFEQAFRMCHEVLGMLHVDIKQVLSVRVAGAAHTMFLPKGKLVQAAAFSVEAIKIFEDTCMTNECMHKRVIAGAVLFCVLACARWFDSMHIADIWKSTFATRVLLEANAEKHKTSIWAKRPKQGCFLLSSSDVFEVMGIIIHWGTVALWTFPTFLAIVEREYTDLW